MFNISTSPTKIEIEKGKNMNVNFGAAANPSEVTYSLFKGGSEVYTFPIDKGVMKINDANKDNSGSYVIQAANSEGVTNYNFSVNVLCKYELL